MRFRRNLFESVLSGFYLALLAPPFAIVSFILIAILSPRGTASGMELNFHEISIMIFSMGVFGYLLGAPPAFVAGLVFPAIRRRLTAPLAAIATGSLAASIFLAPVGLHLFANGKPTQHLMTLALPAFFGTAIAAYLLARRRAEASHLPNQKQ